MCFTRIRMFIETNHRSSCYEINSIFSTKIHFANRTSEASLHVTHRPIYFKVFLQMWQCLLTAFPTILPPSLFLPAVSRVVRPSAPRILSNSSPPKYNDVLTWLRRWANCCLRLSFKLFSSAWLNLEISIWWSHSIKCLCFIVSSSCCFHCSCFVLLTSVSPATINCA